MSTIRIGIRIIIRVRIRIKFRLGSGLGLGLGLRLFPVICGNLNFSLAFEARQVDCFIWPR